MGAGPSQGLHMHVNVMGDANGQKLTTSEVAYVWAAYAKYQLVIHEFFSPSRPGNHYANRHFLGQCAPATSSRQRCTDNPCACNRLFFKQIHDYVKQKEGTSRDKTEFCNYVLRMPGNNNPCEQKYPHQRYFQLNLVPLHKFGTIEFRAHSGTYDPERIFRYGQLLLAFVEHFGTGKGSQSMVQFFAGHSAEVDYAKLAVAQREASAKELFRELDGMVDVDSEAFFT